MKIDHSTFTGIRPSVARICVEMDPLQQFPEQLWIGDETVGFWQQVTYENVPHYCVKCYKLGHQSAACKSNILSPKTKETTSKIPGIQPLSASEKTTPSPDSQLPNAPKKVSQTHALQPQNKVKLL